MKPDVSEAVCRGSQGIIISVEVSAGSRTNSFPSGYNPWRKTIGCSVHVEPEGGKANLAVTDLIADTFDIPRTAVSIVSGSRSSQKKILITGIPVSKVLETLFKKLDS